MSDKFKLSNKKYKKSSSKFDSQKAYAKAMGIMVAILLLLVSRLVYLQLIDGSRLKEKASKQQTTDQIIGTSRGTIYDSTGKKLAISTPTDTITVNPSYIVGKTDDETKAKREKIAHKFADLFGLDYNDVLNKLNSKSSVQIIAKKIERTKVDELKKWMEEEKITSGINIDDDTKRIYPYNNLASNLIGFVGNDSTGVQGIESKWNSVLQGTPGKLTTSIDAVKEEIPDSNQTYIPAENGSDVVLTIDVNIQQILEKYLKEVCDLSHAAGGGTVVAMRPSTGDILGMASYPDYNLNDPYTINNSELQKNWDTMDQSAKSTALFNMWKNNVVSTSYEPGSPYKLITAATALEENITSEDVSNDFYCNGFLQVADQKINCWSQNHIGPKSLRQALELSCNSSLMELGARIGKETLYKYYQAFGFFDKTGIDLPQEGKSTYWDLKDVGPVETATMSFGQRFTITPIQLVSAVSAIANDGKLMKPRIVKQIINPETQTTTDIEPQEVRQVLSKSTAERMRNLMKSVVDEGTGKRGAVAGYSVGGKTGTSEPPLGKESEGYVASYVAIAPTEKPEIVILLAVHHPYPNGGGSHQGGVLCGPYVSKMLTEILPYMGINPDNTSKTN